MAIRVIQWATGGVGRAAIAGVRGPSRAGVGGVLGPQPRQGRARRRRVVRPRPPRAAGHRRRRRAGGARGRLRDLLAVHGRPGRRGPAAGVRQERGHPAELVLRRGPRRVGHRGGVRDRGRTTVHGTGIHPGGITERFPLVVSALSQSITHVRAEEFSDIRSYGAPAVVGEIMLFGKTPEEAALSMMPGILGDGFRQSIAMVGPRPRVRPRPRPDRAPTRWPWPPRPSSRRSVPSEPGRIAAQKFSWEATGRGEPVITRRAPTGSWARSTWTRPGPSGPAASASRCAVTGDPSSRVTFHGWHPDLGRGRTGPQSGRGGHGHPLRERHPGGGGGRAGHPQLPRPGPLLGAGRPHLR